MKVLEPNARFNKITDITAEFLKEHEIKGLILDVDNTLIDYDEQMLEGTEEWCNNLKQNGIKFCIVSNSNRTRKVRNVAQKLNIPYINLAFKPSKKGLLKAKKILNIENKNIAVVGDQIFTDVIGANRCKMHSILVKPRVSRFQAFHNGRHLETPFLFFNIISDHCSMDQRVLLRNCLFRKICQLS